MLILYFFAMYSNLILSTIRTLRLINDLIIIMIFIYFCIEEDKLNFFLNILKGLFFFIMLLWFYTGFYHKSSYTYDSSKIDWVLLSGTALIFSCLQTYLGYIIYL